MRDWRREDDVYAVLTALACSLIVYLVAGNVGLVSSPTTIGSPSPPGTVAVAVAEGPTPTPGGTSQTASPGRTQAPPERPAPAPGEEGEPPQPSSSPTPAPGGGVGGIVEELGDLVGLGDFSYRSQRPSRLNP